jgi:hypothetical protein
MTKLRKIAEPAMAAARDLRAVMRGKVVLPGDDAYNSDGRIWDGAVDHRPALLVLVGGSCEIGKATIKSVFLGVSRRPASGAEPRKINRGFQRYDSGEDSSHQRDGKRKSAELRYPVHFRRLHRRIGGAAVSPRFRLKASAIEGAGSVCQQRHVGTPSTSGLSASVDVLTTAYEVEMAWPGFSYERYKERYPEAGEVVQTAIAALADAIEEAKRGSGTACPQRQTFMRRL